MDDDNTYSLTDGREEGGKKGWFETVVDAAVKPLGNVLQGVAEAAETFGNQGIQAATGAIDTIKSYWNGTYDTSGASAASEYPTTVSPMGDPGSLEGDQLKAAAAAVRKQIEDDWKKAKKEGKTDKLIAKWVTLGILNVAAGVVQDPLLAEAAAAFRAARGARIVGSVEACEEGLRDIAKAGGLRKLESRADAIRKSGMLADHVEAMADIAERKNEILLVQNVNPGAGARIEEGAVPKRLNVKGKSAEGGPVDAYIPRDQSLSKLANIEDDAKRASEVKKYNEIVEQSIKDGHATTVTVQGPDGPIEVLADPTPPPPPRPFTADYDMLAIGRPGASGTPRPAGELGTLSPADQLTIDQINKHVDNPGGNVVPHGPANHSPVPQPRNYPITAIEPDRSVVTIPKGPPEDPDLYLKQYFNENKGHNLKPDPNWGWQQDANGNWT